MAALDHYEFTTHWEFAEPVDRVWREIVRPVDWPQWWPGVEKVVEVRPGTDDDGLLGIHLVTWKSALPYRLTIETQAIRCLRHCNYYVQAYGELEGEGLWTFTETPTTTQVRYDWKVRTTKAWMRWLAPIARPLFRWNHDVVMRWGEQGLRKRLGERSA